MRLSVLASLFTVLVAASAENTEKAYGGKYEGHKIIRVTPVDDDQVGLLSLMREDADFGLDFWDGPHRGAALDLHVTPKNERIIRMILEARGMAWNVSVANLQELVDREAQENFDRRGKGQSVVGGYARTDEIHKWMKNLAGQSSIMTVQKYGSSYEGRDLLLAKLSTGSGRPGVLIHSGLHAREWIAHATVIWIINELVEKYNKDSTITALLNKYDFYMSPVANPDGYEYTHTRERFWRKTRSRTNINSCRGVDPNRNFDSNFGGQGASSNPCSDTYHGPRAFSEKETAAIKTFVDSQRGNIKFYMDVHAYSQMWLTPYGYTNQRPSDYREIDAVANAGANAVYNVNRRRFRVGTPGQLLYIASGGAYDWAKSKAGIKYAYTLELRPASGGIYGFVVSPSEIPASGREIWAGLAAAIQRI